MIFDRFKKLASPLLILATAASIGLSGCSTGRPDMQTSQGTINLDTLRVGVPENIVKEAVLTFVLDESTAAKAYGKSQYLSRPKDSKGGQYMVNCIDGKCFKLDAIYTTPITKEQAVQTLKNMLPGDCPPQSKVEELKEPSPSETYSYGEQYMGIIGYADKDATQVNSVVTIDIAAQNKLLEHMKAAEGGSSETAGSAGEKPEKTAEGESKGSNN